VVAGSFEDGLRASERRDYGTALRIWLPLAEAGDAKAQHAIAYLYEEGKGVLQDTATARKWYLRAAEQGNASSQSNLALMYSLNREIPQDLVQSYKWASIAAGASGASGDRQVRDIVARSMTPRQIVEAQRLAREWKPKAER